MSSRYTPFTPSPLGPVVCNCACQTCLDGGCCMLPQPWTPEQPTYTATTAHVQYGWACTSSGHDFAPLNEGAIYCRKCGTFRAVAEVTT